MPGQRAWTAYPSTYRASAVETLVAWILAGESGSVVGTTGSGKSNLLGFVCNRPEVLKSYMPEVGRKVAVVQVDLNDLPDNDLGTLHRIILRSLFEARTQIAGLMPTLADDIEILYRKVEANSDTFLAQSTLREGLLLFQEAQVRLVLVLDPFDEICTTAPRRVFHNLRGLRDSFKSTVSYIVGASDELAYLREPQDMGKLYKLLDEHLCWLGAMDEADARWVISQVAEANHHTFTEAEIEHLIEVSGGYSSLLRTASMWLIRTSPPPKADEWVEIMVVEPALHHRLESLWDGMLQKEQVVLSEIQKLQGAPSKAFKGLNQQYSDVLNRLTAKGFCLRTGDKWRIRSDLFTAYIAEVKGRGGGKIWLEEETETLYNGQAIIEVLSPLERAVLTYLVKNPKIRHTKTDLIVESWPDELRREGVTDQSLYQVILDLRKKIEPNWTKPTYLVTWRGKPEGGYQFFPEGKPG